MGDAIIVCPSDSECGFTIAGGIPTTCAICGRRVWLRPGQITKMMSGMAFSHISCPSCVPITRQNSYPAGLYYQNINWILKRKEVDK